VTLVRIGIITPTYNRPEFLVRLHQSLVRTGQGVDWIHFVVDDGSDISYRNALERCASASRRVRYKRIVNSGPLVARNRAIEMAFSENCTHLCFIDDDDLVINSCLQILHDRLVDFSDNQWFIFGSEMKNSDCRGWTKIPMKMHWFKDIALGQGVVGDQLHVLSTNFIGNTRFSTIGRNQREWTFFMKLSEKDDSILVMPEVVMLKDYQVHGLTYEAKGKKISSPDSIYNNIERAYCYWKKTPCNFQLIVNLVKQFGAFPVRFIIYFLSR
jgi:glycosyltransferase involved in cell wall biosynthesis